MKKIKIPIPKMIIPLIPIKGRVGLIVYKTKSSPSIGRMIGISLGMFHHIFWDIAKREKLTNVTQGPIINKIFPRFTISLLWFLS